MSKMDDLKKKFITSEECAELRHRADALEDWLDKTPKRRKSVLYQVYEEFSDGTTGFIKMFDTKGEALEYYCGLPPITKGEDCSVQLKVVVEKVEVEEKVLFSKPISSR